MLDHYTKKHNVSLEDFIQAYNTGTVQEPEHDEYFLHDHAVRKSGHDTFYRLESVCANLVAIDLNSPLYKYESDIATTI